MVDIYNLVAFWLKEHKIDYISTGGCFTNSTTDQGDLSLNSWHICVFENRLHVHSNPPSGIDIVSIADPACFTILATRIAEASNAR